MVSHSGLSPSGCAATIHIPCRVGVCLPTIQRRTQGPPLRERRLKSRAEGGFTSPVLKTALSTNLHLGYFFNKPEGRESRYHYCLYTGYSFRGDDMHVLAKEHKRSLFQQPVRLNKWFHFKCSVHKKSPPALSRRVSILSRKLTYWWTGSSPPLNK